MFYLRYLCLRTVVSNAYCVAFLFCFSSSMLTVSLDCTFLNALSVFSNVYLCMSEFIKTNFGRDMVNMA